MTIDSNRLLLKLERARKEINRKTINPEIQRLTLADLEPIVEMVAEVRAAYVKELFDVASSRRGAPTEEQIENLKSIRVVFEETVKATNALETMIKRGYLDVVET